MNARPFVAGELELRVPELDSALAFKCHPRHAELDELSRNTLLPSLRALYATEADFQRALGEQHGLWACLTTPDADWERLCNHAYWVSCWFAFDDMLSQAGRLGRHPGAAEAIIAEVMPVLTDPQATASSEHQRLAQAVLEPIVTGMPASQGDRFLAEMREYVQAYADEVALRARDEVPTFPEYLEMHITSGCACCTTLIEYCIGLDVGTQLAQSPQLRAAQRLLHESYVLVNDLFSFPKEYFEGDYGNAISVFVLHEGLEVREAVDRLCALIADAERRFLAQRDEILASALGQDPDVRRYLAALGHAIAGSLEWSRRTPRYPLSVAPPRLA